VSNITASLSGVSSPADVLTVTAAEGEPTISIKTLDQGMLAGAFYVDLQVTNAGTGDASNVTVRKIAFRTLSGTGVVAYNTNGSPALPIALGDLTAGGSTNLRLFVNVPATVTRFSIAESGAVQDSSGTVFNFASTQSILGQ
jgi:hypothetical protein